MEADPGAVYLLETAKDRLTKDVPGYRVSNVDSFLDHVLVALRGGEPPSPGQILAVDFPITKWGPAYTPRAVDRLIGELAGLLQGPRSGAEASPGVRALVDSIRTSRFGTTRRAGYDEQEVDEFLDRIVDGLIRGERGTVRQLAGEPRFTTVKLRPGYRVADVDSLLDSVERSLTDLG